LVAFDLLQFEGEDWQRLPLEVRRAQLGRSSMALTGD
jgi:ATP-dependent DNA ligase